MVKIHIKVEGDIANDKHQCDDGVDIMNPRIPIFVKIKNFVDPDIKENNIGHDKGKNLHTANVADMHG